MAITATARKLVVVAYLMLKNNEPYRYARPELMREKFSKLGKTATGEKSPVLQTRPKSGLPEVYAAAKLPAAKPPEELPSGERRMLEERNLGDFVQGLYRPAPPKEKTRQPAKPNKRSDKKGRPKGRS